MPTGRGTQPVSLVDIRRKPENMPHDDAQRWHHEAWAHIKTKAYADALASVERALDIAPNCAVYWETKGIVLGSMKRAHDALAALDRALALDASSSHPLLGKAAILLDLKQHEEALRTIDQLLVRDPQKGRALGLKASILEALERYEDELTVLDALLSIDPDRHERTQGLILRSHALSALGLYDKALVAATQAV